MPGWHPRGSPITWTKMTFVSPLTLTSPLPSPSLSTADPRPLPLCCGLSHLTHPTIFYKLDGLTIRIQSTLSFLRKTTKWDFGGDYTNISMTLLANQHGKKVVLAIEKSIPKSVCVYYD